MFKRLFKVFVVPAEQQDSILMERIPLAAAVLLLEIAHADGEFDASERVLLGELLKEHFGVSEDSLADLLRFAEETRQSSSDLHQFTREINKAFTQPEKEEIVEALWKLVYADGRLDCYEDALMRQLGTLIGLSHRQLIDAKLRVKKG
jgi:uncharacterized tellurite resistance protein B-like protein